MGEFHNFLCRRGAAEWRSFMKTHNYKFMSASSVWATGREREMNLTLDFVTKIDFCNKKTVLCAAGSSSYIILVNGEMIAHGPARTAHGYYRVDEIELDRYLRQGTNTVALRVAGYNVNSFSYLDVPAFLCAEIVSDGDVIAYTDEQGGGFNAYILNERIEKVQRYSFQRTFVESYDLSQGAFSVEYGDFGDRDAVNLSCVGEKNYIYRDIPYGDYEKILPERTIGRGNVSYSDKENYYNAREICNINENYKGYKLEELEFSSHIEVGKMDFSPSEAYDGNTNDILLGKDEYVDIDIQKNYTGIFNFELECMGDGIFYLLFDEVMHHGAVNCFRLGTSSIVLVKAEKGIYKICCAEPYVMRYIRIVSSGAACRVKNLKLIKIAYPSSQIKASFIGEDGQMEKIYDAALETFCSNVVDIYMDCPSRERAGWLCDSFFTSRVEYVLCKNSAVEKAFLENFLMPEKFEFLPDGMLPMCYPSDHTDGTFIPNWAMWYALELAEYPDRCGDFELVNNAKDRMYGLLEYFKNFENE